MNNEKLPMTVVEDCEGNRYYLQSVLGQGGQGMVCRTTDETLAVKFLMRDNNVVQDNKIYEAFEEKINDVVIMNLDKDIRLCKPEYMLKKPLCGYVMKLLSDLHPVSELIFNINSDKNITDFNRKTQGLKKRLEVLLELARTLARLHSNGIVYCDISPNNVFYSDTEKFSNVWLIDCDNLRQIGEVKKGIYTPGYGAPEIVNNLTGNTIFSDCFSFALLAFRILTNRDPFEQDYSSNSSTEGGWDASTTVENKQEAMGDWLFENGADKKLKEYFSHFLDNDLLKMFKRTFGKEGRLNPLSRPSMRAWYDAFKLSLTRITKCSCGQYILASDSKCPFCDSNRKYKHFAYICKKFDKNIWKNSVNQILTEIKADEYQNEDFFPKAVKKLKILISEKKYKNPLIVYDGLKIYDVNLFDITVYKTPKVALQFDYNNKVLYLTNKLEDDIILDEAYHIHSGSTKQVNCDKNKESVINIIDPITKGEILVRIIKI